MPRLFRAQPRPHWYHRELPEFLKPLFFGCAVVLCLVWGMLLGLQTQRMRVAVEDLEYLWPSVPTESLTASVSAAQE